VLALAMVALTACSGENGGERPYLEFMGGGFIFNYRLAEADYGFVARVLRPLPQGAVLEAELENPSGGAPFRIREPVRRGRLQYLFRSPPVRGVVAKREYRVRLSLLDREHGRVIARYESSYRSDLDQTVLPERPPVVGPGYQRTERPPG
jgi:hypothetical protein